MAKKDWKKTDDGKQFGNTYHIRWHRKKDIPENTRWLVVKSIYDFHGLKNTWIVTYRSDILKRFTTKSAALKFAKSYMRKH